MTTKAYMLGWIAYLLGSAGVLFVLWYITRPLARWFRLPLRAIVAALLLTPWSVSPTVGQWAPAWVVSLFDGFARNDVSSWRAGGPLLAMVVVAFLVAYADFFRLRRKDRRATPAARPGPDQRPESESGELPEQKIIGSDHQRDRY